MGNGAAVREEGSSRASSAWEVLGRISEKSKAKTVFNIRTKKIYFYNLFHLHKEKEHKNLVKWSLWWGSDAGEVADGRLCFSQYCLIS